MLSPLSITVRLLWLILCDIERNGVTTILDAINVFAKAMHIVQHFPYQAACLSWQRYYWIHFCCCFGTFEIVSVCGDSISGYVEQAFESRVSCWLYLMLGSWACICVNSNLAIKMMRMMMMIMKRERMMIRERERERTVHLPFIVDYP